MSAVRFRRNANRSAGKAATVASVALRGKHPICNGASRHLRAACISWKGGLRYLHPPYAIVRGRGKVARSSKAAQGERSSEGCRDEAIDRPHRGREYQADGGAARA